MTVAKSSTLAEASTLTTITKRELRTQALVLTDCLAQQRSFVDQHLVLSVHIVSVGIADIA